MLSRLFFPWAEAHGYRQSSLRNRNNVGQLARRYQPADPALVCIFGIWLVRHSSERRRKFFLMFELWTLKFPFTASTQTPPITGAQAMCCTTCLSCREGIGRAHRGGVGVIFSVTWRQFASSAERNPVSFR